jgi:hypothetical protein
MLDAVRQGNGGRRTGREGTGETVVPRALFPVPQLYAAAARLLAEAQSGPPNRDTALTLLAADALVTLTCEVVAETAPERLGELR